MTDYKDGNLLENTRQYEQPSGKQYPLRYVEQHSDNEHEEAIEFMEFRLVYDGPLKAASGGNTRVAEKHAIRKALHPQLKALWNAHPYLKFLSTYNDWFGAGSATFDKDVNVFDEIPRNTTYVEFIAEQFDRAGFEFVPLVNKKLDLVCELDILFLRRENPGDLVRSGGDVDNRIKTLLDALRIPSDGGELPQDSDNVTVKPDATEHPFYCLLQDDALVTKLNITTDRLLRPIEGGEHKNDVVLVINVTIKASKVTINNIQFL